MAAGLGFKTFTTGEVLTAADTNGYLMQGINVFASTAARDAAITSPQEGQFAFTKDTNGLWYYDGAAWVASGATGDIEGVTAGVGITGGGTSGTVTITNDMATTITAAGDIVVGTGSGTYDNLPIGTTAQVLTADTTVSPYKVKWATPSSGTPAFVGCSLKFGASQSLSNSTEYKVTFDQEYFDTNTFHDNSTNNSRITIPSGYAGKYLVMANIAITAWNNDTRVSIFKNGNAVAATFLRWNVPDLASANIFYILDLAVSDYLQINMFQSSGSTQTIKGQNDLGASSSFFQVQFLGA